MNVNQLPNLCERCGEPLDPREAEVVLAGGEITDGRYPVHHDASICVALLLRRLMDEGMRL